MVMVAHRLATIQNADVVFEGKVVEKGDRGSLVRKRGVCWEMVSEISSNSAVALRRGLNC